MTESGNTAPGNKGLELVEPLIFEQGRLVGVE